VGLCSEGVVIVCVRSVSVRVLKVECNCEIV